MTRPAVPAGETTEDTEPDDPTGIDWPARQAHAVFPFQVVDGHPINPHDAGLPAGRHPKLKWGETLTVDVVILFVDALGTRWIVLIERCDGHGWALPGGKVKPGETFEEAARREKDEECGVHVPADATWWRLEARYMADPRARKNSWPVTVPFVVELGVCDTAPALNAGSDARRAAWVPADDPATVDAYLQFMFGAKLFRPHTRILHPVLGGVER